MAQPILRISLTVLHRNSSHHIIECLESFHAKSYADCFVVVADAGSIDDSVDQLPMNGVGGAR